MRRTRFARFPLGAFVAVVFWGLSFVAVKVALQSLTPLALTAARLGLGALVLAVGLVWRRRRISLDGRDLGLCVLLGVVLAAHLAIQAYGLTYTSAVHTGWLIGFTPVVIALGAQLFRGERLGRLGWCGVAVAAVGVASVTLESVPDLERAGFGDLLQLCSCLTWAVYTLAGAGLVLRRGALPVSCAVMLVSAVLLLPLAWRSGFLVRAPGAEELGALFVLGVLCSGLGYTLWYRAQARYGAQRTAATLYFEPFVTLVFAILVLEEAFTLRVLLGGCLVLAGVWLVDRGS